MAGPPELQGDMDDLEFALSQIAEAIGEIQSHA